jgi:Helix-turn-helix
MASGWIVELWADVLTRACGGSTPIRNWSELPAIGQLTISRPELLRPFDRYNVAHPDSPVRPFNFISVAYPRPFARAERLRLVAPYCKPTEAPEAEWYELQTGERIEITTEDLEGQVAPGRIQVKSYADVAREHVARPELKFGAPDGGPCLRTTTGTLRRRRLVALLRERLGKEGNLLDRRVEGQGVGEEAQDVYEDPNAFLTALPMLRGMPRTEVAKAVGISQRALRRIMSGESIPRRRIRERLESMAGHHRAST